MRTLYGPVNSWRFGRSLGIDPLAGREKRCPFSCIYCQYGRTPRPTLRRRAFVSVEQLETDLASVGNVAADCVTFAGLGEPTLATNLPEMASAARGKLPLPVVLLTGGALLPRQDVRRDLMAFDVVVVGLDAADESLFQRVNRPAGGYPYSLAAVVDGVRRFRQAYGGRLVLQMMFLQANLHAAPQMADLARSLEPEEVQLNTPLQPALGGPVSETEMSQIKLAFSGLPVRSIYDAGRAGIKPRSM